MVFIQISIMKCDLIIWKGLLSDIKTIPFTLVENWEWHRGWKQLVSSDKMEVAYHWQQWTIEPLWHHAADHSRSWGVRMEWSRTGWSMTLLETGGDPTLSPHSTPTSQHTLPNPKSTRSSSWFSCRKKHCLQCPRTISWWLPLCLSCMTMPQATGQSYPVSHNCWVGSTSYTIKSYYLNVATQGLSLWVQPGQKRMGKQDFTTLLLKQGPQWYYTFKYWSGCCLENKRMYSSLSTFTELLLCDMKHFVVTQVLIFYVCRWELTVFRK